MLKSLYLLYFFLCITFCYFYDKRDDFTFTLVNFPFISSNIPALPAYGSYISQLVHYSRAGVQYSDFRDRTQTIRQKLLKQGYVSPRVK